jgi:hypothetical protein
MKLIRKISIGPDLKTAMHYQVGTKVSGNSKEISDIIKEDKFFDIYVREIDEDVKMIWKSFNIDSVSHIEYDTSI